MKISSAVSLFALLATSSLVVGPGALAFGLPKWAREGHDPVLRERGFLQGFACVNSTGVPENDLKAAEDLAMADLAKGVVVQVEERSIDVIAERSHGGRTESLSDIRSEVRTTVNLTLVGADIRRHPEKPKRARRYYALASLDPGAAAEKIARKLRPAYRRVATERSKGAVAVERGRTRQALIHYARARWLALKVSGLEASYQVLRSRESPTLAALAGGDPEGLLSDQEWVRLLHRFRLGAVRGSRQKTPEGEVPGVILAARASLSGSGEPTPVPDLPVRFQLLNGEGVLLAGVPIRTRGASGLSPSSLARTDARGEATCQIVSLESGGREVQCIAATLAIDALAKEMADIERAQLLRWLSPLSELKAVFVIERPGEKELTFQQWVGRRVRRLKAQTGWPREARIVVGAFSYRDSRASGELGRRLGSAVRSALTQAGVRIAATDPHGLLPRLRGEYWEDEKQVEVRVFLEGEGGEELVGTSAYLGRDKIADCKLKPESYQELQSTLADVSDPELAPRPDFSVRIWTDRGTAPVYQDGEKMTVYMKATRDCHVRLLYRTSDGANLLLYPNRWGQDDRLKANKAYSVPGKQAAFDFVVQAPFGAEILKVVASTRPMQALEGREASGAIVLTEASLRSLLRRLRNPGETLRASLDGSVLPGGTRPHERSSAHWLAEDEVVVNTVP